MASLKDEKKVNVKPQDLTLIGSFRNGRAIPAGARAAEGRTRAARITTEERKNRYKNENRDYNAYGLFFRKITHGSSSHFSAFSAPQYILNPSWHEPQAARPPKL